MPIEQIIQQKQQIAEVDTQSIRYSIINIEKPIVEFVLGVKSFKEIGQSLPTDVMNSMISKPVDDAASGFDRWTGFLLVKRPALLSAIFLILFFGMPFVVTYLAFNQLSGDVQSRGLRYLLLKTERGNIYFGRFLGTIMFSTLVMAFLIAVITFYLGMKLRIYPAMSLIGWSLYGFLALSLLMLPYIALCTIISACIDSPMLSFVVVNLIIPGVIIMAAVGGIAWAPLKHINYLLPWGWQNHLLHPSPIHLLTALLGCLVYTAIFLIPGYYIFEKRDL
jgi:ABC-type transport system involved in multi-copper enzyme maturation permease subunit